MNLDMRKEDGWRHKTLSLTLQTLTVTLGPVKALILKEKKLIFIRTKFEFAYWQIQ